MSPVFRALAVLALSWLLVAPSARGQLLADRAHLVYETLLGETFAADERFGAVLATGDFDRDGFADLVIGAPGETVGTSSPVSGAGAVFVVYGAADGLGGTGARAPVLLHQDVTGVRNSAQTGDAFGASLAVGDFNGDITVDLAVGVPGEDLGDGFFFYPEAGAFHVFLGVMGSGLSPFVESFWHADRFDPSVVSLTQDDELGFALAACNRNGDTRSDLLVGIPGAESMGLTDTGAVLTVLGDTTNLTTTGATLWSSSSAEAGDRAGATLICDYFGGSTDPPQPIVGAPDARGGDGKVFLPDLSAVLIGGTEWRLGSSLALGDFRSEKAQRLLVGAMAEPVHTVSDAGAAYEYRRSGTLPVQETKFFQGGGGGGMGETREPFDRLGEAVALGDFDRDFVQDAVLGVPQENLYDGTSAATADAGLAQIVYGSGEVADWRHEIWTLGDLGFPAVENDNFAEALAVGDFDGDGVDDLAVGTPGAVWSGQPDAGLVAILYGQERIVFADDFETGNTVRWSTSVP